MSSPFRVVVLISGTGTNLQRLIDTVHVGGEPIEIVRVVSSREDAAGLQRAEDAGIPTAVVLQSDHPDRAARDAALADIREADSAYASGDVIRGADAVRKLRR